MTADVFWAVTAVITLQPKTPRAENVFRSAWIPAPPPLSEPAMVKALATKMQPRIYEIPREPPRVNGANRTKVPGSLMAPRYRR